MTTKIRRLSLFPLKHGQEKYFELYQKQESTLWSVGEVSLEQDIKDWKDLDSNLKMIVKRVMAFFTVSDALILDNITDIQSILEPDELEKKAFYVSQSAIELVHMHMYSIFIETYITDTGEKDRLFNAVKNFSAIESKADWLRKYSNKNVSKAKLVAANAFGEGLFFSTSFSFALFFKIIGKLHGFCFANEMIMRDENLHCEQAYTYYEDIRNEGQAESESVIHEMAKEALDIQYKFVDFVLQDVQYPELDGQRIKDYATYICDLVLVSLGYTPLSNIVDNPLPWMVLTSFKGKTNFFERRVSEYSKLDAKETVSEINLNFNCIF